MRDREKRKPRTDKSLASSLQQATEQQQQSATPERDTATHAATGLQDAIGNQAVLAAISGAEQQGLTGHAADTLSLGIAGVDTQDRMPGTGSMSVMRAMLHADLRQRAGLEAPDPTLMARIGRRRGRALPPAVRARMEQAFDHDFDHVRVHTDPQAARTAQQLEARAFTTGADIWFGPGEFSPDTPQGQQLLAHELAHVVQADEGRLPTATSELQVSDPSDRAEHEADTMARMAVASMAPPSDLGSAPARLPVDTSFAPLSANLLGSSAPAMGEASDTASAPSAARGASRAEGAVMRKGRNKTRQPRGGAPRGHQGGAGRQQDQGNQPQQMQPEDFVNILAGVIAQVMPEEAQVPGEDGPQTGGPQQDRGGPGRGGGPREPGGRGARDQAPKAGGPDQGQADSERELTPLERLEGVLEGAIPVPMPQGTDLIPEQVGEAFEALGEDTQQHIVGLAEDHVPQADELLEGVDIDVLMRSTEALDNALQEPEDLLAQGTELALNMGLEQLGGIDHSLGALNLGLPELYHDKDNKQGDATLKGPAPRSEDQDRETPGGKAKRKPSTKGKPSAKGKGEPGKEGTQPGAKSPTGKKGDGDGDDTQADSSPGTDSDAKATGNDGKDGDSKDGDSKDKDKKKKGGGGEDVKPMSQKEVKSEIKRLERKKGFREIDIEILDVDIGNHEKDLGGKQGRIGKVQSKQERNQDQTEKRKALLALKQQGGGGGGADSDNKLAFLNAAGARIPKQLSHLQGQVDKINVSTTKVSDSQGVIQDEIAVIDEELQALYDQLKQGGGGGGTGNPDVPLTCKNLVEDVTKEQEKQTKVQETAKKAEIELDTRLKDLETTIGEKNTAVAGFETELGSSREELQGVDGKITAQAKALAAKKKADATKGKAKGKGKTTKGTTKATSTASDKGTKELKARSKALNKVLKETERKRKAADKALTAAKKEQATKKLRLTEKQLEIKQRDEKLHLIKKAIEILAKPTIHFNMIAEGVGVKVKMAWLPKDARPWEEGDENLSETDRQKKDEDWKKMGEADREKGLEERKQEREAEKLQAQSLEVATGQKKPGETTPKTGDTLTKVGTDGGKKKETPEEEAKRKQLEQDNLMRQIGQARDMAPDKREQLLVQLAKDQKPRPRNEAQVQTKIAELNSQFDKKLESVDTALNTTLSGQYPGKIPSAKLADIAGKLEGVSVEDLKRRNENIKRTEFQRRAAAYLGMDPTKEGLAAQDAMHRLGADRGLSPRKMLMRIQFVDWDNPPKDLAGYKDTVAAAKKTDTAYQKDYGDKALGAKVAIEEMQKGEQKAESKHQDNLLISTNLGIKPLEVDVYVKTLCETTGITEVQAREQFKAEGPAGYDPTKQAPVPAELAKQLEAIRNIPDIAQRQEALKAITAKMPPKAMLGALLRAGSTSDGLVTGPVANDALKSQVEGIDKLPSDKQFAAFVGLGDMTGMPFRDLKLSVKNRTVRDQALNGASGILNNTKLTSAEREQKLDDLAKRLKLTKEQLKKAYAADMQRTEAILKGFKSQKGSSWTKRASNFVHKQLTEIETKDLSPQELETKLQLISESTGVPVDRLERYHAAKFRETKEKEYGEKTGLPPGKAYDQLLEWSRAANVPPDQFIETLRNASPDKLPPAMRKAQASLHKYDAKHPDKANTDAATLANMKRDAGLDQDEKAEKLETSFSKVIAMPDGPAKLKAMKEWSAYKRKVRILIAELDENIVDDDEAYAKLKAFSPKELAALMADNTARDEEGDSVEKSFKDGCDNNPEQRRGVRLFRQGDAYNSLLNSDLEEKVQGKRDQADAIIGRGQQNTKIAAALGGADAQGKKTPIPVADAASYIDAYAAANKLTRDQAMNALATPPDGQSVKSMIGSVYTMDVDPATGKKTVPGTALKAELSRANALAPADRDAALLRIKAFSGLSVKDIQEAQKQVVVEGHIVQAYGAVELLPKAEQDKALRKIAEDMGMKSVTNEDLERIRTRYHKAMDAATARYESAVTANPVIKGQLQALSDPSQCPVGELRGRVASLAVILNMTPAQLMQIVQRKRFQQNISGGALKRWGGGTPDGEQAFLEAANKHHMSPEEFADYLSRTPAGSLGPFAGLKKNVDAEKDLQLTAADQKARKAALGDPNDPRYIKLSGDLLGQVMEGGDDDAILALMRQMTPAERALFVRQWEQWRKDGVTVDGDTLPPIREAFYDALQGSDEDSGIDLLNSAVELNRVGADAHIKKPVDIHDNSPGGYADKRNTIIDMMEAPGGPNKFAIKASLRHMSPAERAMFMKEYAQYRNEAAAQVDRGDRTKAQVPKDLNILFEGDHTASIMLADAAKFQLDPVAESASRKAKALTQEIHDTDTFIASTGWKGDRESAYATLQDMAKQNGRSTSNWARIMNGQAPLDEKNKTPAHLRSRVDAHARRHRIGSTANARDAQTKLDALAGTARQDGQADVLGGYELRQDQVDAKTAKLETYLKGGYMSQKDVLGLLYGCNNRELAALDKALASQGGLKALTAGRKNAHGRALIGITGEKSIELKSLIEKADRYKANAADDQLVLDLKQGDPRASAALETPGGLADRLAWMKDLPEAHRDAYMIKLQAEMKAKGKDSIGQQMMRSYMQGSMGGDPTLMTNALAKQVQAASSLPKAERAAFMAQLASWGGYTEGVESLEKAHTKSTTNLKAAVEYQKIKGLPPAEQIEKLNELTLKFQLSEGELDVLLDKALENGMLQQPTKDVPAEVDGKLDAIKKLKDPVERRARLKALAAEHGLSFPDLIAHVNKKNTEARNKRQQLTVARRQAEDLREKVQSGNRESINQAMKQYADDPEAFQRLMKEYPGGAAALKEALKDTLNKTNTTSYARGAINFVGGLFGREENPYGNNDTDYVDFMNQIDRAEKFAKAPTLPEGVTEKDSRFLQDILKTNPDPGSDDYKRLITNYKSMRGLNDSDFESLLAHAQHQVTYFEQEVERAHYSLASEVRGSLIYTDDDRIKTLLGRMSHEQLAALYAKDPSLVNDALASVGGDLHTDFSDKLKSSRDAMKQPFEKREKFISKRRVDHKAKQLEREFGAWFSPDRDRIREMLKDCTDEELKELNKRFGGLLQEKIDDAMKPTFFEAAIAVIAIVAIAFIPGLGLLAAGAMMAGTALGAGLGAQALGIGHDPESIAIKARIGNATNQTDGKYTVSQAKVDASVNKLQDELNSLLWVSDSVIMNALASLNPAELLELDKRMKLPPPKGIEITDKDGNRLSLQGLIEKHLDGDEKAAAVALMKGAEDAVSGVDRREDLESSCKMAAIDERMKELAKDPRHAKKSPRELYKLVMADQKTLKARVDAKKNKIKDSANTLFKAIDGWGDDEKQVLKTLATLTPDEIELVKVEYRRHFGKDLETQMREDMGLGDWKPGDTFEAGGFWESSFTDHNEGRIALMMMSKTHRVEGVREMLLEYSDRAVFEDEDLIFQTLENMKPEERTKLVKGIDGQMFLDRVKEDLGTNEAALVDAITAINIKTGMADANPAHIAAVKMKMAMHGSGDWWDCSSWGTEEDDFLGEMDKLTPAQVQEAIAYYNTHLVEDGSFMQEVIDDFSTSSEEFQVIDAEVRGDKAAADAWRLEYAASGWGTDEKLIEETLKAAREGRGGRTKEHFARLKHHFEMEFGQQGGKYADLKDSGQSALQVMLGEEMDGLERVFFEQLADKGQADPELELLYSMHGAGTDEERAKKILERVSKMSPQERAIFKLKFESLAGDVLGVSETLEQWVDSDFSGSEGFEMKLLVMGEPRTPQDFRERARMRYDFERSGVINGIGNVFMDGLEAMGAHSHGSLMTKHMGEIESMFGPDGKLTDPAKFEDLKEICDWETQDTKNYREVRDKATDYVVTAIQAIGAVICMIIPGGQAFSAAWIAYLVKFAASMAVTAVSMLAKQALSGNGYGWEQAGVDLAQGVLEAATAGLGGMREFQKAAAGAMAAARGIVAEGAEQGFKKLAKESLEEAVTGGAQSLISGVITSEAVWENGGEGELFKHLLKETAMGAFKSGAMSFVGAGMKKTPWGKKLEDIEQDIAGGGPKPTFLKHYGLKYVNEVATAGVGTALDHNKWESWAKGEGFDVNLLKGLFIDPAWKSAMQTGISRSSWKKHKEAAGELSNAETNLQKYQKMLHDGDSNFDNSTLRRLIAGAEDTIQSKQTLISRIQGEAVDELQEQTEDKERQVAQGRQQIRSQDIDPDEIGSKTEHVAIRREVDEGMDSLEDQTRTMRRKIDTGDTTQEEPTSENRRKVVDTSNDTDDALQHKTRKVVKGETKLPTDGQDSDTSLTQRPTKRTLEPQELEDGTQRFVVFDNFEQVAGKKASIIGAKAIGDDGDFSPELKAKLEKLGYTVRKNNVIARADTGAQVPLHLEDGRVVAGLKHSGKGKTPTHLANELLPGGSRGEIWKRAKGMVGQEITTADGKVVKVAKVVPTVVREGVDSEGQSLTGRRIAILTEDGQTLYRPVSDFQDTLDPKRVVAVKNADDVEAKPVIQALARGDASDLTGGDAATATQVFSSPAVRKAVNKQFDEAPAAPAERRKQVKNLLDGFGGDFIAAHTSFDTVESKAVKRALNEHRGRLVGSLMAEVQEAFPGLKVKAKRLDPNSPTLTFEFEGGATTHARAFLEQAAQDLFGGSLKKSLGVQLSEGPVKLRSDADTETAAPRRVQGEFNDPISYEEDGVTKYFSDGKGGKWGYSTSFGFAGEVAQDGAFVIRQKVVLVSDDIDDPAVQRVMADVHAANDTYYNDPSHRIVVDDVERPLRQVLDVEIITKKDLADRQSTKQKAAADAAAAGDSYDPGIEPTVVNVNKGAGRADSSNLFTEGPDTPADDQYRQMVIAHEFAHAIWGLADRYEDGARQVENPSYDPAKDPPSKKFIDIRSESRKNASALHVSHEGGLMEDFNVAYAQGKQALGAAKSWEDLAGSSWKGLKTIYDESNKAMPVKDGGRQYDWALALKRLNPQLANEDGSFPAMIPAGAEVVLPKLTAPDGFGVSAGNLKQLEWHIAAAKQGQVKFELGDGSVADQVVQAEKSKAYAKPKQQYSKGVVSRAKSFGFDTDSLSPDVIDATRGRAKQSRRDNDIAKTKGGDLPAGTEKSEFAGPKDVTKPMKSVKSMKPGMPDQDTAALAPSAPGRRRQRVVDADESEDLDRFFSPSEPVQDGPQRSHHDASTRIMPAVDPATIAKATGHDPRTRGPLTQADKTTAARRTKAMALQIQGTKVDERVLVKQGRDGQLAEIDDGATRTHDHKYGFHASVADDGTLELRKAIKLAKGGGDIETVRREMQQATEEHFNKPGHELTVDGVKRRMRVVLDFIDEVENTPDAMTKTIKVKKGRGHMNSGNYYDKGSSAPADTSMRLLVLAHEIAHSMFGLTDNYKDSGKKTKQAGVREVSKHRYREDSLYRVADKGLMDGPKRAWKHDAKHRVTVGQSWEKLALDYKVSLGGGRRSARPSGNAEKLTWFAKTLDALPMLGKLRKDKREAKRLIPALMQLNPHMVDPSTGQPKKLRPGDELTIPMQTAASTGLTQEHLDQISWSIEQCAAHGRADFALGDGQLPDQLQRRAKARLRDAASSSSSDDWSAAFTAQAAIDNARESGGGTSITQKLPTSAEKTQQLPAMQTQPPQKSSKTRKLPKRHHDEVPSADTPTMVMKAFDPKEAAPTRVSPASLSELLPSRDLQALRGGDSTQARTLFADPARRRAVAAGIANTGNDTSMRQSLVGDLIQGFGGDFRSAHASFAHGDSAAVAQALETHRGRQVQVMLTDLQHAFPALDVSVKRTSPDDPTLRLELNGDQANLARSYLETSAGLGYAGGLARSLGLDITEASAGVMPPMMRAGPDEDTLDIPQVFPRRSDDDGLEITAPIPEVTAPMPELRQAEPERDLDEARRGPAQEPSAEQLEAFRRNNINYDFHEEDTAAMLAERPELQVLVSEHGLTHEEVVALYAYTRQDYADINMGLRGQDAEQLAAYRAQIDITAAALEKLPSFRGSVFRRADAGDWLDAYQPGASVTEHAFTSTSTDYDTQLGSSGTGKVEFVIKSRTGKDITQLSGKGELENEVLFGPAARFTVADRVVDDDGTVVIYMDEQPTRAQKPSEEMLPAPSPGALAPPAPTVEDAPTPAAPKGGKRARKPGPEELDLDGDDQTTLVAAGLTKKEANRIISHREMAGGVFELDEFVALNPNVNAKLLAKLARVAGREDDAVGAVRRIGETEAEAAQRIGLDPMEFGRREEVTGVAEVHNHFKGVLGSEAWAKLAFPTDYEQDPISAANKTIELLKGLYVADDEKYSKGHNDEARDVAGKAATGKILDILGSAEAQSDPVRTLQRVLTASGEMPFDYTYDPRGLLIKKLQRDGRAEAFVRSTMKDLADQGITYAELQGKLETPGVTPELFAQIGKEYGVAIRMLPHLLTSQFAEGGDGFDEHKLQQLLFGKNAKAEGDIPDMVGGIDICGPENGRWDEQGTKRLEDAYKVLQRHALLSDRTLVFRPHVGEGYSGTEGQRRHGVEKGAKQGKVAQDNLEMILTRLEGMQRNDLYAKPPEGKVEVRLGHVTQATASQIARMKQLGVIAEVNIGSNLVTGALGRADEPSGSRLDKHPLMMLLYHDVHTLLSTDAGGVMSTDMAKEYGFAADMLQRFRDGETTITVPDPKDPESSMVLRYKDLPAAVQKRFHIEHLERSAKAYARLGRIRHNETGAVEEGGWNWRTKHLNASKVARLNELRLAEHGAAEEAALSRNLDSNAPDVGATPEERIERLQEQLEELNAMEGASGSGGASRSDLRRAVVQVRDEVLRDLERQLKLKHPGASIQRTSAGSDRLDIQVVETARGTEAADDLEAMGAKILGEKWLNLLGIRLNVPADPGGTKKR